MPFALALRRNSSLAARESEPEAWSEDGAAGWDDLGALGGLVVGLVEEAEAAEDSEEVLWALVEAEDDAGRSRLEEGFGDGSLFRWWCSWLPEEIEDMVVAEWSLLPLPSLELDDPEARRAKVLDGLGGLDWNDGVGMSRVSFGEMVPSRDMSLSVVSGTCKRGLRVYWYAMSFGIHVSWTGKVLLNEPSKDEVDEKLPIGGAA